jgi:hypothetical protein
MEIKKNRYGDERSVEKIGSEKFRVMGESQFSRTSEDGDGNITMFDFEGGPCFNIGGTLKFKKVDWTITSIKQENTRKELCSVIVEATL